MRLHQPYEDFCDSRISDWLSEYAGWLSSLFESTVQESNGAIMAMYRLLLHLEKLINSIIDEGSEEFRDKKEIYRKILSKLADSTATFFRGNHDYIEYFPKIISRLDSKFHLLALNVNFMASIEVFFLEILQMVK